MLTLKYAVRTSGNAAAISLEFAISGGVAQLGERCVRNAEVGSSILLLSTTRKGPDLLWPFSWAREGQCWRGSGGNANAGTPDSGLF